MNCFSRVLLVSTVIVAAVPTGAAAQVTREPRIYQGIFGGTRRPQQDRVTQDLDLTISLMGGYDESLRPAGIAAPPLSVRLQDSGYRGSLDAGLRYRRGRRDRWFALTGRGFMNGYSNREFGPAGGGSLGGEVQTRIGRRSLLNVSQSISSTPSFRFGSSDTLDPVDGIEQPPASEAPEDGLFQRRSWQTSSSLRWRQRVGRRDSVDFSYNYSQRSFVEDDRGNTSGHQAGAAYSRRLGPSYSLRASYRFVDRDSFDYEARERPVTTHTVEGGPAFSKALSPARNMSFSFGVGAMYVDTLRWDVTQIPLTYWTPFGQAAFRMDLARSWALGANYRRQAAVYHGATRESFVNDRIGALVSGHLTRRLNLAFNGGYAVGQGRLGRREDGRGPGELQTYSLSTRLRFALNRHAAFFADYSYYRYQFSDPIDSAFGFPPEFSRNAVRVGVSLWVPLAGRYRGR